MKNETQKFSKKFLKEPLCKKYLTKTWEDAQEVSEEI
jgi:hypothetical protein